MDIQRITTTRSGNTKSTLRVADWGAFIGQKPIVKIVKTAMQGSINSNTPLGHLLLTGPSGHGKTTLARIVADEMNTQVHYITAYALQKPADIISLLNSLQENDIIFLDEIHRCKPIVEEVLYIAMEDFAIDMILPDGKPLRLPLKPFTLIGATTKPESLSAPLKNRFVYKLHFSEYSESEKEQILIVNLERLGITLTPKTLIKTIVLYASGVPREIGNLTKQLSDRLFAHHIETRCIDQEKREHFRQEFQLKHGGLTPLHQEYIELLKANTGKYVGVKTIAVTLGVHEKTIEEEIEPPLLKMGLIQKTIKGRMLVEQQ